MISEPRRSLYPVTDSVVDWLSHTLEAVDEGAFLHFSRIRKVTRKVDKAERGSLIHRLQARSHLREYNEQNLSNVQWDEVVHRCKNFIPAFQGEWVVFTDRSQVFIDVEDYPEDTTIEDLLTDSTVDIEWAVLWDPMESVIVVYRSPKLGFKRDLHRDIPMACGMTRGDSLAFMLPDTIEGAIKQDLESLAGGDESPSEVNPERILACMMDGPRESSVCITEFLPWLR